jgi:hypothetical protein
MLQPRPARRARKNSLGQSLAIFAIAAVVLFGVVGLAIDSSVGYYAANRVERAAAAGALAGVTYMPDQYSPKGINAAMAAVQTNGFADDGCVKVCVVVYKVPRHCDDVGSTIPCVPNQLGVEVGTQVDNSFTKLLGFGANHWVRQNAVAEFLSTLTLGQPGQQLGSTEPEINGTPQQGFYFLRTEGWGAPRSEGDAYTPNPASASPASTDVHTITVEPALPASSPGNVWTPLPSCGGYDFQIAVPATEPAGRTVRVEVYNPAFAPDGSNSYREHDGTFDATNATQYDTMMYTLFQENDHFNRATDSPVAQVEIDPLNATSATQSNWTDASPPGTTPVPLSTSTALFHQWVDPFPSGGLSAPPLIRSSAASTGWNDSLTPGQTYRLRVDTMDGTGAGCASSPLPAGGGGGHKGYAVRVVDAANTLCVACTLGGINELAFYTPLAAPSSATATFDIPMVNVPSVYAGETIDIYAFDPGDVGNATNYVSIIDSCPSSPCSPAIASDPSNIKVYDLGFNKTTTPTPALLVDSTHWVDTTQARVLTSQGGSHPYNGHWLLFKIPVATTYAPASTAQQYWSLRYELTGGTATDTLTVSVGFDGPPVHLVPTP